MLWVTLVYMPCTCLVFTLGAALITWWHGYSLYFMFALLLINLIAIPSAFFYPRLIQFFATLILIVCFLFDTYAMVTLFFPQLKGWGEWTGCTKYSCVTNIYFQFPADFNYAMLLIFFGLILIFGGKKFFELDMEAMLNKVHKRKEVMRDHTYFLGSRVGRGDPTSFEVIFKPKFLVRSEHWVHSAILMIACYFILPLQYMGGVMAKWGNSPFVALFFFVMNYFFLCFTFYLIVYSYAYFKIRQAIEKELGVKLKPVLWSESGR